MTETQAQTPTDPQLPPAPPELQEAMNRLRRQDRAVREEAERLLIQSGQGVIPYLIIAAEDTQRSQRHRVRILKVIEAMRMEVGSVARVRLLLLSLQGPKRVKAQAERLVEFLIYDWVIDGCVDPELARRHQTLLIAARGRALGAQQIPEDILDAQIKMMHKRLLKEGKRARMPSRRRPKRSATLEDLHEWVEGKRKSQRQRGASRC